MSAQRRHIMEEAIVGDCLHSSTREDSRQGRLLRHVSDLQQRHLDLARHVQDLETALPYQLAEPFPAYLLDAYRSPSPERTVDDSADGWGSWTE